MQQASRSKERKASSFLGSPQATRALSPATAQQYRKRLQFSCFLNHTLSTQLLKSRSAFASFTPVAPPHRRRRLRGRDLAFFSRSPLLPLQLLPSPVKVLCLWW